MLDPHHHLVITGRIRYTLCNISYVIRNPHVYKDLFQIVPCFYCIIITGICYKKALVVSIRLFKVCNITIIYNKRIAFCCLVRNTRPFYMKEYQKGSKSSYYSKQNKNIPLHAPVFSFTSPSSTLS